MSLSQTQLNLRIDWSELDYFGHVNNVSYFKYIQAARVNFWENIGLYELHNTKNIAPILVSSKCDFKKPLFFPGNVNITSEITEIKNTSFCFTHQLYNDKNEFVAEAFDVMVLFDYTNNTKIKLSKDLSSTIDELNK